MWSRRAWRCNVALQLHIDHATHYVVDFGKMSWIKFYPWHNLSYWCGKRMKSTLTTLQQSKIQDILGCCSWGGKMSWIKFYPWHIWWFLQIRDISVWDYFGPDVVDLQKLLKMSWIKFYPWHLAPLNLGVQDVVDFDVSHSSLQQMFVHTSASYMKISMFHKQSPKLSSVHCISQAG